MAPELHWRQWSPGRSNLNSHLLELTKCEREKSEKEKNEELKDNSPKPHV